MGGIEESAVTQCWRMEHLKSREIFKEEGVWKPFVLSLGFEGSFYLKLKHNQRFNDLTPRVTSSLSFNSIKQGPKSLRWKELRVVLLSVTER